MRKFKQGLKMAAAGMVVMAGPSLAYAGAGPMGHGLG